MSWERISARAPFSKTFRGSGDAVCWSVKRALLSQGYMLDRSTESGVLTGTRDFQPDPKLNVSYHLQTTCADNRDGTSIVFATATREDSQLQRMKQSTSMGIGPFARLSGAAAVPAYRSTASFPWSWFDLGESAARRGMVATTRCFPATPVSCRV
jgi:Uncharacterized protein conserved in bacteria (DUF2242)